MGKGLRQEHFCPLLKTTRVPKIRDQSLFSKIQSNITFYRQDLFLYVTSPKKVTFSGRNSKLHFAKAWKIQNNNRTLSKRGGLGPRGKRLFSTPPPYPSPPPTFLPIYPIRLRALSFAVPWRIVEEGTIVLFRENDKSLVCGDGTKQILEDLVIKFYKELINIGQFLSRRQTTFYLDYFR